MPQLIIFKKYFKLIIKESKYYNILKKMVRILFEAIFYQFYDLKNAHKSCMYFPDYLD